MLNSTCIFKPSHVDRIKELTETLEEDYSFLELFFNLSPDMLCIINNSGYFVKLNPAWQRELGWSIQELTEKPFYSFLHPDDVDTTTYKINSIKDGKIVRFYNRFRKKNTDDYIYLEWSTTWSKGMAYAVIREVSKDCLSCPIAKEKFDRIGHNL